MYMFNVEFCRAAGTMQVGGWPTGGVGRGCSYWTLVWNNYWCCLCNPWVDVSIIFVVHDTAAVQA